ncbi:cyanate hydratase [Favolaschia claudopus]|uniref:Cyanate hydratase n=1 Tax=Favolaschia claudopus TaxID=2862362 RepID=A0AAW0D5S0_9AGAR
MRATLLRLAESFPSRPLNLTEYSASLLPPKPLYRRILRAHRGLAADLRYMGDNYVKAEFRRHEKVTNPVHVIGFLSQWKVYLDGVPKGPGAKDFAGKKLDPTDLSSITTKLLEAKAKKGLTFDDIAKAIGKDEVWVASAFYGQAKFTAQELAKVTEVLGLSVNLQEEIGENWWPNRGLGTTPPTDPVIYRLYEGVLVYGHPIKAIIHEKINIEKKPDPKGDRVVLTFE